jgi:hypothetical protein
MASDDWIINECGTVDGMRLGKGNLSARRKLAPVTLCPPKISHDLICNRTRAVDDTSRYTRSGANPDFTNRIQTSTAEKLQSSPFNLVILGHRRLPLLAGKS